MQYFCGTPHLNWLTMPKDGSTLNAKQLREHAEKVRAEAKKLKEISRRLRENSKAGKQK
jgi:hypothetical protein